MPNIETRILDKFTVLKDRLNHPRIAFAKIESRYVYGKWMNIKFFLSIILVGEYRLDNMSDDKEAITEIVVGCLLRTTKDITEAITDLTYGNGIYIKSIELDDVDIENEADAIIDKLENQFFSSIEKDIYDSLDSLVRYN